MRNFLLIIFLFPLLSYGQNVVLPVDSASKKVMYQEVVKLDNVSKDELYVRAHEWFVRTFKSSKEVIQMDDKQAGKIIGKGVTQGMSYFLTDQTPFILEYTVSMTTKDGRYRYEIGDFIYHDLPSKGSATPQIVSIDEANQDKFYHNKKGEVKGIFRDYFSKVQTTGTSLSTSIKDAMSKKATGSKSKDDF